MNDDFAHYAESYKGGPVVRMDTSQGGHPTGAYIRAYHEYPEYRSYLFIQDSMRGIVPNIVRPFRQAGAPVVAWGIFPMAFDNYAQRDWVLGQYPDHVRPRWGIFGPTFYATRKAMEKAEPYFPAVPENRLQAQGTERAWALTFAQAGVDVGWLGEWDNHLMSEGPYPVFRKTFALRP